MEDATFQKQSVSAIWAIRDQEAKKIEVLHIQIDLDTNYVHVCNPVFFPSIMWPSFEHTYMCVYIYI